MRLQIYGARGSTVTPGWATVRYGGNTACVALHTDAGALVVLDAGSGLRRLGLDLVARAAGQPIGAAICISHFHWDHIQGIPFFAPLYEPKSRLSFFAAANSETSFQELLEAQMDAPYFPVSMRKLAGQREFYEISEQQITVADCRVTMRRVNHPQRCMSFRVESSGAVVAYITDHEPDGGPFDENVLQQAEGADVLILDAQYTKSEYDANRRGWGHGTWEQAVHCARLAGARQLLLFHHDPDRDDQELDKIVRSAQRHFRATAGAAEGISFRVSRRRSSRSTGGIREIATAAS